MSSAASASPVPAVRVRSINGKPHNPRGDFVVYWMIANRRVRSNFSLDRAIELSRAHQRPLLVLEALRVGYPYASDRLHRFVIAGMADNARRCAKASLVYYPYLEPEAGAGKGLLEALAARAVAVVTDDFPCFFLPQMVEAAGKRLGVALEAVDSNGLYPMHATARVFTTAHSFRVHLQKELKPHLFERPAAQPLEGLKLQPLGALPKGLEARWPKARLEVLEAPQTFLAGLPIDHSIGPVARQGGSAAGEARLSAFVARGLDAYAQARNAPSEDGTSGLSAHLHFGHVGAHQVLEAIAQREGWSPKVLGKSIGGSKEGWWQVPPSVEAFLDEAITWRELAYNQSSHQPQAYRSLDSLAGWAQVTIAKHAGDARAPLYSLQQLERAQTHDPLWNAVQRQLLREGWFHGYLRMLWGKKIYEWSPDAAQALARMESLMNRYSLDGRNPCSYSGYFWVLGRYDRPWGPERKIFGKLRYMSSDNTAKKLDVKPYLSKYS